jgi:hypothetical protein
MATTVSVWNAFLNRTILVGSIKPNIYENLGFFRGDEVHGYSHPTPEPLDESDLSYFSKQSKQITSITRIKFIHGNWIFSC